MPAARIALTLALGGLLAGLAAVPASADDVRFGLRLGERSGAFIAIGDAPLPHARPHPRPHPRPRPDPHLRPGLHAKPGTGGIPRTGIAPPPGAAALNRRFDTLTEAPEPRRRHRRRHRFAVPVFVDDDDDDGAPRVVFVPVPSPAPREPEPVAAPAPPPDPRGPLTVPVRGAPAGPVYAVGEPLPADLPHVTLDWRRYGLPAPPAGLVYARVGRDVLLIEPVSRRVERRVDPAALAPEATSPAAPEG